MPTTSNDLVGNKNGSVAHERKQGGSGWWEIALSRHARAQRASLDHYLRSLSLAEREER